MRSYRAELMKGSAATLRPTCFITAHEREPVNDAAAAISKATLHRSLPIPPWETPSRQQILQLRQNFRRWCSGIGARYEASGLNYSPCNGFISKQYGFSAHCTQHLRHSPSVSIHRRSGLSPRRIFPFLSTNACLVQPDAIGLRSGSRSMRHSNTTLLDFISPIFV